MNNEYLELRMYFFVPYNISEIQKGIQAGHAALEYANKYSNCSLFKNFVINHKTWIILNGGTTNNGQHNSSNIEKPIGTLNEIENELVSNKIKHAVFFEEDLNDAMTAICFIADERVWNYKDHPNYGDYLINKKYVEEGKEIISLKSNEELKKMFPIQYEYWIDFIGGEKNVFLRELIKNFKLA